MGIVPYEPKIQFSGSNMFDGCELFQPLLEITSKIKLKIMNSMV